MEPIALSVEKMNRLKELGIDTSDSSLFWVSYKQIEDEITFLCPKELLCQYKNNPILKFKITPAYTLQDIINLLPKCIKSGSDFYKICIETTGENWAVYYYRADAEELVSKQSKYLIDVVYEMLCWYANTEINK